ncbi:2-dehydro-3-deoxygalactonokinase [Niveispirillum sp. KHB5.9]|uniref:2-dehydro-3-deoxygalactonokinase n=1 Tax=Niveispirillum sp. KHB5.9 TaxID=3400269 RepID=UPI003A888954
MKGFIAGDWGTSNLRLFLCRDGRVTDRVSGPGIAAVPGAAEATLLDLIAPWRAAHGTLPIFLSGMIGSSIGWVEAPYIQCPAGPSALRDGMRRLAAGGHEVAIASGLACTNPLGAPDVMRGEETQILGALATHPDLGRGRQILCLPGTHSKWALLNDGRVEHFQTAMTGELFATLHGHSILGRGTEGLLPDDGPAFQTGLARGLEEHGTTLPHLLFEARSRQLRDGLGPQWALSFLSGLLVGQDCVGTRARYRPAPGQPITIIAAPVLGRLYESALSRLGITCRLLSGDRQSLAGLFALAGHELKDPMT